MEPIKINVEGNETKMVTGSDTFNVENDTSSDSNDASSDIFNDSATGSDTDTGSDSNDTATGSATIDIRERTLKVQNIASLETYIAIFKKGDIMQKRGMAVKMVVLALIERGALYTAKGYTSTIELAEKEFHLSAQTTRSYLQAAEKFYNVAKYSETVALTDLVDDSGNFKQTYTNEFTSIFADLEGNDFAPSALESMRSLPVETIEMLLADNVISYDMSARDIKKAVKPYRQRAAEKVNDTDNNDINTGSDTNDTDNDTGSGNDTDNDTGSDTETIEQLKAQIEQYKIWLADMTNANQQIQAKNAALQAENDALANKIETLQAANKKLTDSNNSYKAANSRAKKANDTLKAENDTLKAENETLKAAGSDTDNDASSDTDNDASSDTIPVTITGSGNDTDNNTGSDNNDNDTGSDNKTGNNADTGNTIEG